jgi:hypothetical protein
MSTSLHELVSQFENGIRALTDETDEAQIEQQVIALTALEGDLTVKAASICGYLDRLESEAARYKRIQDEAQRRCTVLKNIMARLEQRTCENLRAYEAVTGRAEIGGIGGRIKVAKAGGVQALQLDEAHVPEEYKKEVVTTSTVIDKDAIRVALKNGTVQGAVLLPKKDVLKTGI